MWLPHCVNTKSVSTRSLLREHFFESQCSEMSLPHLVWWKFSNCPLYLIRSFSGKRGLCPTLSWRCKFGASLDSRCYIPECERGKMSTSLSLYSSCCVLQRRRRSSFSRLKMNPGKEGPGLGSIRRWRLQGGGPRLMTASVWKFSFLRSCSMKVVIKVQHEGFDKLLVYTLLLSLVCQHF